jgi:hypothetical protein
MIEESRRIFIAKQLALLRLKGAKGLFKIIALQLLKGLTASEASSKAVSK